MGIPSSKDEVKDSKIVPSVTPVSSYTTGQRITDAEGLTLFQWWDGKKTQRRWVTADMIAKGGTDGETRVDRPERGIPHGDDLSDLGKFSLKSDDLALALNERGVWTYADVMAMPEVVLGALQSLYGVSLSSVLQAAGTAMKAQKASKESK